MTYRNSIGIITLALFLSSCNSEKTSSDPNDGLSTLNKDTLAKHIAVLAGDDYLGRKPFSEGEVKTIHYLEDQFKSIGLEPGNGSSYFQEVPMVRITTDASYAMQVKSPKGNFTLKGFDDYVIWTDKTDSSISLDNTELVFAGYGVVAPQYGWNDYEGLDVKGKVVLLVVNDPGFHIHDPALFKGDTMTYYGRWTYKFEEAARQGAKGCLIIHDTEGASYPFTVIQNNWNTSRLRLDNRGKQETLCDVIGWISGGSARKLLAAAGKDSTLLQTADKKGFKGESLGIQLSASMKVKTTYDKSNNVIGKITGTKYPDETIIYTAHWDHLGIGKPDETGDSIYNGALDNASGTAGLLELARGFKSLSTKPERTVIFLAVTAEEQGLWGSAYYAQNPIYPANKTLANINMDGLNYYGKTKDIIVVGHGQSDLEDYLKEEASKVDRVIAYESRPEAGSYYRSDHFNFAKVGIPALYVSNGIDVIGKEKGYGKMMEDIYTEKNYHRPSDEFSLNSVTGDTTVADPKEIGYGEKTDNKDTSTNAKVPTVEPSSTPWVFDGAIDDLKLLFQVGKRMAFGDKWPEWKEGSEFKAKRDASNK